MHVRDLLAAAPTSFSDVGLGVMRFGVGAVFLAHGYGDVFDAGISTNVQNYRDAGIPLPAVSAPYTATVQLIGGAMIVIGFLTRVWVAALFVVMAGALLFVHWGEPLVMGPDGSGSGFAFIMGISSVALLILGPGRLSVDALLLGGSRVARPQPTS